MSRARLAVNAAVAAAVRVEQGGPWRDAIALMKDAGVYDVKHFIMRDTGERLDQVWTYELRYHHGAVVFERSP